MIRRQNPPNRGFPEFGGFGRFQGKSPNLAPRGPNLGIWGPPAQGPSIWGSRAGGPRGTPGRGSREGVPGGPPGGGPGRGSREGAPGGPLGPPETPNLGVSGGRKPRIWGFPPPIYISGYIYIGGGRGGSNPGFSLSGQGKHGVGPVPHLSKITPTSPDR